MLCAMVYSNSLQHHAQPPVLLGQVTSSPELDASSPKESVDMVVADTERVGENSSCLCPSKAPKLRPLEKPSSIEEVPYLMLPDPQSVQQRQEEVWAQHECLQGPSDALVNVLSRTLVHSSFCSRKILP